MRNTVKSIVISIGICIIAILSIDVILSNLGFEPTRKDYDIAGRQHPLWDHDLKPNLDTMVNWGPHVYRLCTNEYGFASDCENTVVPADKHYDIAFLGDSFTEGIGLPYAETWVGLYDQAYPEYRVANLGVSSYSPSIYYRKMVYYLEEEGMSFNHVVVLPDISDIADEGAIYVLDPVSGNVVRKKAPTYEPPKRGLRDIWRENFVFTRTFHRIVKRLFREPVLQATVINHPRGIWTFNQNAPHYGPEGVQGAIEQAVDAMRRLKHLLDKYNIPMTVAVYPWPDQIMQGEQDHMGARIWREFCEQENCAGFIDINEELFERLESSDPWDIIHTYYIDGDIHFNAAGNQVLFETIDRAFTYTKSSEEFSGH